jgi:hypothetical protein
MTTREKATQPTRQIKLTKALTMEYIDAQGERYTKEFPAGTAVDYTRVDLPGWTEHWVTCEGLREDHHPAFMAVRFSACKWDFRFPVVAVTEGESIPAGAKVLVDGTYAGEFRGLVETNQYTGTKQFKVWCPELNAHSYSLTVQVIPTGN